MNKEIGRSSTFFELLKNDSLKIEIPIIQRDYAQGRDNAVEIRTNFLKTIRKHLDLQRPLNLDFVYGSIENNRFIPIDGQQRLTTLFLLHWYLAWASENQDHYKTYLGSSFSKFTYETRISSRDFCNLLISQPIKKIDDLRISSIIKNQFWFYLNWIHDSTVIGMLNTIDSVEQIFNDPEKYYKLLTDTHKSLITFQYIELKDFGLSDQLYIKMNSRGKPLTEFENLKANIEQIFEEYDKRNDTKFTQWLTSKIDGEWTDIFWSFLKDKSQLIDNLFINFMRVSVTNFYALEDGIKEEFLKLLLDSSKEFNFFMLEGIGFNRFEPIHNALSQFESLTTHSKELFKILDNKNLLDEEGIFRDIIYNLTSYPKRIQHFALCSYLTQNKDASTIKDGIRIIRNLSENSRIEDAEEFVNALKTTNRLVNKTLNLSEFLLKAEPSDLVGFSNYQSSEEILKTKLINSNPGWKDRIESIEDHSYLKGHIGFILEFCGINELFENSQEFKMEESVQNQLMKEFDGYTEKVRKLMKEDGIIEFKDFLFERALFSIGDYTLQKGRNFSFLINGNEREISWKRYLRSDKKEYLKTLLDEIDLANLEFSLQSLIDGYNTDDYKYFFIKFPEIIANTGRNKFIRYYSDKDILLLEKNQTNGAHREYYSFAVFCELKNKGYNVSYHPDSNEYYTKHIYEINGQEIFITFYPYDGGYWIESDIIKGGKSILTSHTKVIESVKRLIPIK